MNATPHQLKGLIFEVVNDLASIGLSAAVLQELLERGKNIIEAQEKADGNNKLNDDDQHLEEAPLISGTYRHLKAAYIVNELSGHIDSRLRLWVDPPMSPLDSEETILMAKATMRNPECDARHVVAGAARDPTRNRHIAEMSTSKYVRCMALRCVQSLRCPFLVIKIPAMRDHGAKWSSLP